MLRIKMFMWLIAACVFAIVSADDSANCAAEDVVGYWMFYEEENRDRPSNLHCSHSEKVYDFSYDTRVYLTLPHNAVDRFGNKGNWTIVNGQGFEVLINYRRYFAYFDYYQGENVTISYCNKTLVRSHGKSHDILGNNWSCFRAIKEMSVRAKTHFFQKLQDAVFQRNIEFINHINQVQNSWTAREYPELYGKNLSDIIRRSGGLKSRIHGPPKTAQVTSQYRLPETVDWRKDHYVSPVRNQGWCGSSFAFATNAMLEARLRIATKNSVKMDFSSQELTSCFQYTQFAHGCEGGSPYLAAKYVQDFGVVSEHCNPYSGTDDPCTKTKCKRHYVADYKYLGGYYGACNEQLMKLELVNNGPFAVTFEVHSDFQHYSGGVYSRTVLLDGFNSFVTTNHAGLIVGYGTDDRTKVAYWLVKNSWGEEWGEKGYFRIRRGTNECNIESMVVVATPIP